MKEALLYEKEDVRILDVEIPTIGPKDILLKVRAAKICPTDVRKYTLGSGDARIKSLPMNLCHEYAGEIVEVGENVKNYKKGMRVTGFGMKGNAEYVKLSADDSNPYFKNAILEIPPNVSYEEAAFTTPLSECMHCIIDQAGLRFGETIAIIGAGHMGIQQANISHWSGAYVIVVDLVDDRLEVAKALGADVVINAGKTDVVEEVKKLTGGAMADCSIATLGIPPVIQSAIDVVGYNGRIVLYGGSSAGTIMQFNPNDIHYSEKHLIGIEGIGVGSNRHVERRTHALRHIASGKIDLSQMITRVMPMSEIVDAYEMIRKREALT
ncbi:MAG: zinc-binding dehydrogenase, partial [Candidatus Thorarchaeota archaeon]